MKIIKPFYFDEFVCVGGKCKDTCCVGWNILIDKKSSQKYKQVEGEFGEKLKNSIVSGDVDRFVLDENERCPFLDREQLCEIFINLGEDKMCDVCKIYPRFYKKYNDVIEEDLTLSCPEVARILVSYKKPVDFLFVEITDDNGMEIEIDKINLFNALIDGRGLSVDIMQKSDIPFWKRLYMCINIADKIQQHINKEETNKIKDTIDVFQRDEYFTTFMSSLDVLNENFSLKITHYKSIINIISQLKITNQKFLSFLIETVNFFQIYEGTDFDEEFSKLTNEFDIYNKESKGFENYVVYYLFHYYMSAYKDGNINKYIVIMVEAYSIMKLFAIVRWYNNGFYLSEEETVDIFYSYSRFIEHGSNTMSELFDQIKNNGLDNPAYLVALIR